MKAIGILFLAFLSFTSPELQAQVNLQNNEILYISTSSDILFIDGSFANSSTATLTNNGQLYVRYNLNNDESSMPAGSGKLFLNGPSTQTISGSQVFNTYDLQTDNSSGIALNNNLSGSGTHTYYFFSNTEKYFFLQRCISHQLNLQIK
ncbi:MAG: hypothetical protein ABUT20_08265 [Bacteroidota bacterium]